MAENEAVLVRDEENEEIKPIIVVTKKQNIIYRFIKRAIDIFAGLVGVILLIPLMIVVEIIRIAKKKIKDLYFMNN